MFVGPCCVHAGPVPAVLPPETVTVPVPDSELATVMPGGAPAKSTSPSTTMGETKKFGPPTPLPICSVPALTVVGPPQVRGLLASVSRPVPTFVRPPTPASVPLKVVLVLSLPTVMAVALENTEPVPGIAPSASEPTALSPVCSTPVPVTVRRPGLLICADSVPPVMFVGPWCVHAGPVPAVLPPRPSRCPSPTANWPR